MIVFGAGERYAEGTRIPMEVGRFFSGTEVQHRSNVAVLGNGAYQLLFKPSGIDPIGKTVRVGNDQFVVVGVFAARPAPGNFSLNQDDFVVDSLHDLSARVRRPHRPVVSRHGWARRSCCPAIPREGVSQEDAIADIERVMRSRHGLRLDEQNDFDIVTQDALMRVWNQISQATFFALVVISSIALMVGGIGVMAIMSISVTERTREIGVRRALGARRREVLFQFLTEAAVLTSVGGSARHSSRQRPRAGRAFPHRVPRLASALVLRARHRLLRHCRHRLRHVSRHPRRAARSDRSVEIRVASVTVGRLPFTVYESAVEHSALPVLMYSSRIRRPQGIAMQDYTEARGVAEISQPSSLRGHVARKLPAFRNAETCRTHFADRGAPPYRSRRTSPKDSPSKANARSAARSLGIALGSAELST